VDSADVDEWVIALDAFIAAHKATGMRAFVVSTITELLPRKLRERLIAEGITPLQGMDDALFALSAAATYHEKQTRDNGSVTLPRLAAQKPDGTGDSRLLDESESKSRLSDYGLSTPAGAVGGKSELPELAGKIGYPVAVKAAGAAFAHKSEMGAVVLDVQNSDELAAAADQIAASAAEHGEAVERFLIEKMITGTVAELIIGINRDAQFGPALVIGTGGLLVELVSDSISLLLPTDKEAVAEALMSLKVAKLLEGFRGKPAGDRQAVIDAILAVAAFAMDHWDTLEELDVNPLIVLPEGEGVIAADALIRLSV
jgi:acyl-CoA synthetase (NDP forming)